MANGSHAQYNKIRESPRDWRILRFLKRAPRPAKVVGELEDGELINVAVTTKAGNAAAVQWSDATAALHACVKISALDSEGAILRVLPLDPNDPELQAEAERDEQRAPRGSSKGGSVPLISVDVPKLVDNLAKNMQLVAASAASAQERAFSSGFQAMTSVVNLCLTILMRVDSRLEQAEQQAALQVVEAPGAPSARDQMMLMALQKAMGGGGGAAPGMTVDPAVIAQIMAQFQQQPEDAEPNGHA